MRSYQPVRPANGRRARHIVGPVVLLSGAWSVLVASPAGADPPTPTDYRSTVTGVSPPSEAIEVSVIGGDALLQLEVAPGHDVVVMGYDDQPYLRFRDDGTVEENRQSAATYANANRYGDVELPEGLDPEAMPSWQRVAGGGSYAWHDHRIHWMSPDPPPGVARGSNIQHWAVPLVIDDEEATIEGVLRYEPATAWWPWIAGALGLAVAVWLLGRSRRPSTVALVAAGVGCLVSVAVAAAEQLAIPREAGRNLMSVAVPAVGLLCALLAGLVRKPKVANAVGLAAAAAVAGWAMLRSAVFTKPVLPTNLDPALDRAGTAAAVGLAIAAAVLLVAANRSAAAG